MSDNFSDHFSTSLYTPINVWQNKKSNQHTHTHKKTRNPHQFFFVRKKVVPIFAPAKEKDLQPPLPEAGCNINWDQLHTKVLGSTRLPPLTRLPVRAPQVLGLFFFGGGKREVGIGRELGKRRLWLWLCFFFQFLFFGICILFCLIYVGLRLVFLNLIFWHARGLLHVFSFGFQVAVKMVVIALFCWEVLLMEEIWISSRYIVYHISWFAGILHNRWCSILSINRLNDAMMKHGTLRSDKDCILRISTGVNGCVPIEAGWE